MQFHDYINLRNTARLTGDEAIKKYAESVTPDEFRLNLANKTRALLEQAEAVHVPVEVGVELETHYLAAIAECEWICCDRPFYNIWPVASELASSVKLDIPVSFIEIPFASLVLRFAQAHEPGVKTAMIWWWKDHPVDRGEIRVFGAPIDRNAPPVLVVRLFYPTADTPVESWLTKLRNEDREAGGDRHPFSIISEHLIRLTIFVGLLANDNDIITPIVLSKDRAKYDATDNEEVRQALERRAARRLGRGFDVGKALQREKEETPHWRNPHFALFWTGKGRMKPILKMRRGAIVYRASMAEVPTGYLGPESSADSQLSPESQQRTAISSGKRFEIFKRDGYRCQLCGAKADDGAALHVDHRIAVVKGGSNDDDNLWTLCDRCNLGKSDADL